MFATAAAGSFPSAGGAGVDSVSARIVWQKIYGACPAMLSPGNAQTVEGKMDSATSEGPTVRVGWRIQAESCKYSDLVDSVI